MSTYMELPIDDIELDKSNPAELSAGKDLQPGTEKKRRPVEGRHDLPAGYRRTGSDRCDGCAVLLRFRRVRLPVKYQLTAKGEKQDIMSARQ